MRYLRDHDFAINHYDIISECFFIDSFALIGLIFFSLTEYDICYIQCYKGQAYMYIYTPYTISRLRYAMEHKYEFIHEQKNKNSCIDTCTYISQKLTYIILNVYLYIIYKRLFLFFLYEKHVQMQVKKITRVKGLVHPC